MMMIMFSVLIQVVEPFVSLTASISDYDIYCIMLERELLLHKFMGKFCKSNT